MARRKRVTPAIEPDAPAIEPDAPAIEAAGEESLPAAEEDVEAAAEQDVPAAEEDVEAAAEQDVPAAEEDVEAEPDAAVAGGAVPHPPVPTAGWTPRTRIPPIGPLDAPLDDEAPPADPTAGPSPPDSDPTPRRATLARELRERGIPVGLAGWTLVVAVAMLAGAAPALAAVVVGYALFAPGLALVRLLRLEEPVLEGVLAIVVSVSLAGLVALAQVYLGLWAPDAVIWLLVVVTALAVAADPGLVPAPTRARLAAAALPATRRVADVRARVARWLATPVTTVVETTEDGQTVTRPGRRPTARELRPPKEVPVPRAAWRPGREVDPASLTTVPDHLLESPQGVAPASQGFFEGLVERHEKRPPDSKG